MLLTPNSSTQPAHDDAEVAEDGDEPPDHYHLQDPQIEDDEIFARPTFIKQKESLLTRALKSSPEMSPTEKHLPSMHDSAYSYRSYPHSNISGLSTAELTSDGGLTSPSLSNTPSPPLPPQMMGKMGKMGKATMGHKQVTQRVKVVDTNETIVEANLGRRRCISFACAGKSQDTNEPKPPQRVQTFPVTSQKEASPPPLKRQSTLTFVCPGRQSTVERERSPARKSAFRSRCRGSPAPVARKASPPTQTLEKTEASNTTPKAKGVPTSGLGKFEESEATRFHEFASSVDEDDEWVKQTTEFTEKITMNDCMKKENEIRRLGREAEEEAEEEEDDDDDIEDLADDDSTVHDFSSDDGNESDNEAGFADSDDSDDDGSDYEFWAPSATASDTNVPSIDVFPAPMQRRASNTSYDSMTEDQQKWLPAPVRKGSRRSAPRPIRMRPGTPNLPDSTDFVCGTLDEDRPLEAAYKSCIEQRRMSKHVLIPQDIDPSFPTSDPEAEEDLEDLSEDLDAFVLEPTRGRTDNNTRASPRHSPKRMVSPPPSRRAGRISPKRLKSPPPRVRAKSPSPQKWSEMPVVESPRGVNISNLIQQRQPLFRTKSLPRTPNPFFATDQTHRYLGVSTESPERERSRTRELHNRGPIDIVEGLEKKRQKRKEKFWRQHCRKAAKEQAVRRPIPGKGAERMKELGLEVAERCRAYGVAQDTQLVLSV
ncbi:hypothetical protein N7488_010957 [Penicillium malachiteum]|nr:hypothetical protein N7488_010957 [Penicillium malachiteum]